MDTIYKHIYTTDALEIIYLMTGRLSFGLGLGDNIPGDCWLE
jgi:hypothetical protein